MGFSRPQLRRTATWDQGHERAEHVRFTVETGVQVYFCVARSPWQRASSETTNGLLRQYFPKGSDLVSSSRAFVEGARWPDARRRRASEALARVVAMTH